MGLIRKVASIMMLGGVSSHTRHEPPGKGLARGRGALAGRPERGRRERGRGRAGVATRPLTAAGSMLVPVAGLAPPSVGLNRFF